MHRWFFSFSLLSLPFLVRLSFRVLSFFLRSFIRSVLSFLFRFFPVVFHFFNSFFFSFQVARIQRMTSKRLGCIHDTRSMQFFIFFGLLFTVFVAIRNSRVQNWARGASDVKKGSMYTQAQRKENIYHQNFNNNRIIDLPGVPVPWRKTHCHSKCGCHVIMSSSSSIYSRKKESRLIFPRGNWNFTWT